MKKHFATGLQLLVIIALAALLVRTAHADVIMDWNAKGDEIAAEKQFLLQTRVMSMLHIAMFEAVNAVERRYTPYKLTLPAMMLSSRCSTRSISTISGDRLRQFVTRISR
jgi:hypothetical protein